VVEAGGGLACSGGVGGIKRSLAIRQGEGGQSAHWFRGQSSRKCCMNSARGDCEWATRQQFMHHDRITAQRGIEQWCGLVVEAVPEPSNELLTAAAVSSGRPCQTRGDASANGGQQCEERGSEERWASGDWRGLCLEGEGSPMTGQWGSNAGLLSQRWPPLADTPP
jgi:hypothetical protein